MADANLARNPRGNLVRALAAGVFVVALSLATSGCQLGITEPPDYPPAIRNLLDESVDIYDESTEDLEDRAFVAGLGPGEVHELPEGARPCRSRTLVAIGDAGEVGRLDDPCLIGANTVWVLHAEGHYVADYYGKETVYWPD